VACSGTQQRFNQAFVPQVRQDARIHAFMAASIAHAAYEGHMVQWEARLEQVQDDLPLFFEGMSHGSYRAEFEVVSHPVEEGPGKAPYEYYGTPMTLVPRKGAGDRFVLPGEQGTTHVAYLAQLVPASRKSGVPAEVLRRGHFAFFKLATMTSQLNALDDMLRRHAFALLVLRDKFERKEEKSDPLAPMRPPEKSLEDVQVALRVIADHHAATAKLRSEVMAVVALASSYDVPEAREALAKQIEESRARAQQWRTTHPRPTQEQFGVAMNELKLPTPDNLLAVLDRDGYIAAAVNVARNVATGNVGGTIEALGKLAPPDSSLRVASEGIAAALKGDIAGTARAVLALAEKQEDVAEIASRLRSVEQAVTAARGAARDAGSAISTVKKAPGALKK
jgi:hypothetical protein